MAVLEPPAAEPPSTRKWPEYGVLLNVPRGLWTDDGFFEFCQANPDLRIEQTATGKLIIMPPAGAESGRRNADLTADLTVWNRRVQLGALFDSSTGFTLPNGAKRSPDASWIVKARWEAVTPTDRQKFAHICPDFVAELRSEKDSLATLQKKMHEYLENGARLGWLIDPKWKRVEVYRPDQDVQVLDSPQTVSGDPELSGFTLDLEPIWQT